MNTIHQIVLDATQSPNDNPAGYSVYISTDSSTWTGPIATGIGSTGMTLILFPDQVGRYIKIVQTGSKGNYWSIHEFYVWGIINSLLTAASDLTTASTAHVTVFPNPVTGQQINVQLLNLPAGKYHLRLINHLGQLVYTTGVTISSDKQILTITPNGKLPSGNYILELTALKGKPVTRKLVIPY
jgi:hypothetical protein